MGIWMEHCIMGVWHSSTCITGIWIECCITGAWMEHCIMGSLPFHVIYSFLKVSGSRAGDGASMIPWVQSPAPRKAGLAVHPILQHLGGGRKSI